ncbi:MAG: triose-phosphate isomerase [Alphaproteobacteria bacterium]|nr:triose-phosphate isomerase [Alphaproteobacteria bacterium]
MTAMRRPLIAGNWKMNGLAADGLALARSLADAPEGTAELLVCPPATLLAPVASALSGSRVALGGQDCHVEKAGAHTGDVSAEMLADAGCAYVITGHSERRAAHGESDAEVRKKAAAAHRAGLIAIVCVGETAAERDAGAAEAVVAASLLGSLPGGARPDNTVVAYEPVWAIGTGRTPTVDEVVAVHAALRAALGDRGGGTRILYGGSVKPDNAAALLAPCDVDGALVGGASLSAADFLAIAGAA